MNENNQLTSNTNQEWQLLRVATHLFTKLATPFTSVHVQHSTVATSNAPGYYHACRIISRN